MAPGPPIPLTPEELARFGQRLYGSRAWITRMANALGVTDSTVWRWAHGKSPIGPVLSTLIRKLYAEKKARSALDKAS